MDKSGILSVSAATPGVCTPSALRASETGGMGEPADDGSSTILLLRLQHKEAETPAIAMDRILSINDRLDCIGLPHEINEIRIETFLEELVSADSTKSPAFWLTMARLTELTLMCAGHYADNCEFSAAGDLLVNPRKVLVRIKSSADQFVKERHGWLSDQLASYNFFRSNAAPVSRKDTRCEIVAPALLPYLQQRLIKCGYFEGAYLNDVEARMKRVADVIGFLAAYQVSSNEDLHQRLQFAGKDQKTFVHNHLCAFDRRYFDWFGRGLELLKIGLRPVGKLVS